MGGEWATTGAAFSVVMPGLVPGIHALFFASPTRKAWMAGTSPAMTVLTLPPAAKSR
jgi:hypothetical protein